MSGGGGAAQHEIVSYMKDATTLVLEQRPADPIAFLAEYFQNVIQGSNPLLKSYRHISSSPRSIESFMESLAAAYAALASSVRRTFGAGDVTGAELGQLLTRVCHDFPDDMRAVVFAALDKKEGDVVAFPEFAAALRSCLRFKDLLAALRGLFEHLADEQGAAHVTAIRPVVKRLLHSLPTSRPSARDKDAELLSQVLPPDDRPESMVRFEQLVRAVLQVLSHRL